MKATIAQHEAQIQALERQTTPAGNGMNEDVSYPVIYSHTR